MWQDPGAKIITMGGGLSKLSKLVSETDVSALRSALSKGVGLLSTPQLRGQTLDQKELLQIGKHPQTRMIS